MEHPPFWVAETEKTPVIFLFPEAPAGSDSGGLCARWGDAGDRDSRWGYHSGIMGISWGYPPVN